ncbi:glycosyltransferase [Noviherbaspirillum saxi]|uniref:Glycosyltransferase n=1 Tax=Noviherbaspirillum saxi TaxID=2320863 RepID=A0A3A3FL23_9BURK|nr:glycosyltransferase [Noviherbaspirillum saxi]RJF95884.1 glycosyltransferase [Noviherbaspirillum saxi]
MKRQRVCHMSSSHRGLDTRIYHKQCVSLATAGYDTHLIINATKDEINLARNQRVTVHPLPTKPHAGRLSRLLVQAWRCYTVARQLDADLYHFHDPELMPYGLMLARSGKRVIFDAHEDLPAEIYAKDWIPTPVRSLVAGVARQTQQYGAVRLSAVVAATPYIGSLFDGVARRVAVINNYPLIGELVSDQGPDRQPRDSVCYIGGIDAIRGIKETIQAIGKTQAQLLLAGFFSSNALRNEVMQYTGWNRVKEYGFVDRKAVSDILARSFAGLVTLHPVPNTLNSQPIKMFEYMSAGVPVVSSDFPLWRKIITENACGICVDHNDPDAIAAAIRYLHEHPDQVRLMGNNGRRAIEQKYRWDNEEAKLTALYADVLAEDRSGSI